MDLFTVASMPTPSQRQTTSAENHLQIRVRMQIRAERRLSAERRSCAGEGKSGGKCSSSSLKGDHLVGGPAVCLICLLGTGREHLSSGEGNHMYFTYVGDPQLSHHEPPHADAGLHQCIDFPKQPVDSEAFDWSRTRWRKKPSGAT